MRAAALVALALAGCAHLEPGRPDASDRVCQPAGVHSIRIRAGTAWSCAQCRELVAQEAAGLRGSWLFLFTAGWPGLAMEKGGRPGFAAGETWPSRRVIEVRSVDVLAHEVRHARDAEEGKTFDDFWREPW